MVIKLKTSFFEVLKNTKEALNLEQLEQCYIEEWYDSFPYIVGDISDSKLRLKQFNEIKGHKDYFHRIPDYLIESCTYKPAYFILHKISEEEYLNRIDEKITDEITSGDTEILKIEKVPFDKESLVLEKTKKNTPYIRIDIQKENQVKIYPLPEDLKREIQKEKLNEQKNSKQNKNFSNSNNRNFNNSNNKSNNNNQKDNVKNNSNSNNNTNQNNQNKNNNQANNNKSNFNNPNNSNYKVKNNNFNKNPQKDKSRNGE